MARHLRRLDVPGGAYDPLFQDIARLLELLADPDMPITPDEVSLDFPEPGSPTTSPPSPEAQIRSLVSAKGVKSSTATSPRSRHFSRYALDCISISRLTVRLNSNAPSPAA